MNQSRPARPVLIVGAGPTGLTAAVELSRLGVDIRVIDRSPAPSTTSKALAVQARTVELLQPRGVGESMLRAGKQCTATSIYGRDRKLATVEFERIPGRFKAILLLPQSETERLLSEQLHRQGVDVERGVELISFTQDASDPHGGVRAVLENSNGTRETLDAAYLIGADGAHSSIRHALGLPFAGTSLAQSYLLADLHLDGDIPKDEISIFLSAKGFVAIFPITEHRCRFMATAPDMLSRDSDAPTLQDLQSVCDGVVSMPARLRDMNWSSWFVINSRHLATLRVGNVFLGGDAAHVHSPAGGQGMNTGIQDMINLCWKLALVRTGDAKPSLLDTYQTERLPLIGKLVRATETATKVFNSTNPIVYHLLTHIAPIALGTDRVQNMATAVLGEVSANYRDSPIAHGGGRVGRLRSGDRIPDIEVVVLGDRPPVSARLYELLDLGKLTLVVTDLGIDTAVLAERLGPWRAVFTIRHVAVALDQPDLRGHDADVAADLRAQPGFLLIRPDAYVAAVADESVALSDRLDAWFVRANAEGASC
ncbi:FAD-dependent monooxygenase [Nocardia sp. NPDC049220]|uniref:FAD-dependent monooxygenase n=1 Tax=Nocardia sp. NPDC049220 TaxID=3155273 RepID=UPI003405AEE2